MSKVDETVNIKMVVLDGEFYASLDTLKQAISGLDDYWATLEADARLEFAKWKSQEDQATDMVSEGGPVV